MYTRVICCHSQVIAYYATLSVRGCWNVLESIHLTKIWPNEPEFFGGLLIFLFYFYLFILSGWEHFNSSSIYLNMFIVICLSTFYILYLSIDLDFCCYIKRLNLPKTAGKPYRSLALRILHKKILNIKNLKRFSKYPMLINLV